MGVASLLAGRYEVGALIGCGGMADVHAGRDRRLDRPVALKVLRRLDPHLLPDRAHRHRFEREALATARLVHPNVVSVFDAGGGGGAAGHPEAAGYPDAAAAAGYAAAAGHPDAADAAGYADAAGHPDAAAGGAREPFFIVMELLAGTTLADEVAAGPLGEQRCREVALQVLSALHAAHRAGIVHRDVKPANVLHGPGRSFKVADFGIASLVGSALTLTATGTVLGTPAYMAPERVAGHAGGPPSDLYSVGAMLYECLAGRRPFEADNPLALAAAIGASEPLPLLELRPGLAPDLAEVVGRAMAKDPALRFGSAAEMAHALGARRAQPSGAAPAGPRAAPTVRLAARGATEVLDQGYVPRPPRRRPGLKVALWSAAGIMVALGLTLLALGGHARSHRPPATVTTVATTTTTTTIATTTTTTAPVPATPPTSPLPPGRKPSPPGKGDHGSGPGQNQDG